jgi:hypothetical protein
MYAMHLKLSVKVGYNKQYCYLGITFLSAKVEAAIPN